MLSSFSSLTRGFVGIDSRSSGTFPGVLAWGMVFLLMGCGEASSSTSAKSTVPGPSAAAIETPDVARVAEWLQEARALLNGEAPATSAAARRVGEELEGPVTAVLSLSRPAKTARVAQGAGESLRQAVLEASRQLAAFAEPTEIETGVLKLDLVLSWQREDSPLEQEESSAANRPGQYLDRREQAHWLRDPGLLLLPGELLSRQMMDGGGALRPKGLESYLLEEGRQAVHEAVEGDASVAAPESSRVPVVASFLEASQGRAVELSHGRLPVELTPESLLASAVAAGEYLLRHQLSDGSFGYNYDPRFDGYVGASNLLRQAGTCYSLFELFEATRDKRFLEAGERGIEFLLRYARPPKPEDEEAGFEALVSRGGRAKLGGSALILLALVKHYEVSGDERWRDRMGRFARFLTFQQAPDGRFEHLYFFGKVDPKPFESLYYPGEAVLALVRFSRLDPAGPKSSWFNAAERGAGWLMGVRDLGKTYDQLPHDHWLLMALDELHQITGGKRLYYLHGRRIAQGILSLQRSAESEGNVRPDWVGSYYTPPGSTSTATRSEALVAMHAIAIRARVDSGIYGQALERAVAFQLRCQFSPENVFYLPRPDRALGGFRQGLAHWNVRIDYVQHNLSSLLGLREIQLASS